MVEPKIIGYSAMLEKLVAIGRAAGEPRTLGEIPVDLLVIEHGFIHPIDPAVKIIIEANEAYFASLLNGYEYRSVG